jgi:periplasmic protein TonB
MSKVKHSVLKTLSLCIVLSSFAALRATTAEGTEFDVRPTPLKTPPPDYPVGLKQNRVSGVVALRVEIDETGAVIACVVTKSSNVEFEQPALNAVKNWKFTPAQKSGSPVKAHFIMPIKFSVDE